MKDYAELQGYMYCLCGELVACYHQECLAMASPEQLAKIGYIIAVDEEDK